MDTHDCGALRPSESTPLSDQMKTQFMQAVQSFE